MKKYKKLTNPFDENGDIINDSLGGRYVQTTTN